LSAEKEPLHVQFARVCMGWTHFRQEPVTGHWLGLAPTGPASEQYVPRVDLPNYDLMPWESANELDVAYLRPAGDGAVRVRGYIEADRFGGDYREHIGFDRREAVLRVLIALFEAGRGIRPEGASK
jgi:glycine/D-amino acid oxidase-like deaminating enzyme